MLEDVTEDPGRGHSAITMVSFMGYSLPLDAPA